jgi:glycosyltransferase involved in cell wall biosynthesis
MPISRRLGGVRRRYLAPLAVPWALGHALSRTPALLASWRSDAVWIERTIVPGLDGVVHLFRGPRVLDIDDAIWLEGITGLSAPVMARGVDAVIAGNQYLADWASQYCKTIHIVPTAVDAQTMRPRSTPRRPDDPFVIGWMGSTATLPFLAAIQAPLARVLNAIPRASLLVLANDPPILPELAGLPVRFIPWSPQSEVEALHQIDVGIMPLPDDAYTRGKCSLKMLQYMAGALPVVVSPVGMNQDLLNAGEIGFAASTPAQWIEALHSLHDGPDARRRMGATGRTLVEQRFDVRVVAARLAEIFKSLD